MLAPGISDIGGADFGGVFARLFQHLVGHVDSNHAAARAHLPCGKKAVEADVRPWWSFAQGGRADESREN
jgi:hypothetical protein